MEVTIEKGKTLFQEYKLEEAKAVFEALLGNTENTLDIFIYLGKINARTQNYGEALNCYNKALEIDSKNEQAITGLQLTKNILQLANNFYFENAYTDEDLYDF